VPAKAASRRTAITLFSQVVGKLLLSRAVAALAPALADEIFDEGRQHLLTAVDTQTAIQSPGHARRRKSARK
jgi:TetR/AcrR family transcriptional repressor of nem operon